MSEFKAALRYWIGILTPSPDLGWAMSWLRLQRCFAQLQAVVISSLLLVSVARSVLDQRSGYNGTPSRFGCVATSWFSSHRSGCISPHSLLSLGSVFRPCCCFLLLPVPAFSAFRMNPRCTYSVGLRPRPTVTGWCRPAQTRPRPPHNQSINPGRRKDFSTDIIIPGMMIQK